MSTTITNVEYIIYEMKALLKSLYDRKGKRTSHPEGYPALGDFYCFDEGNKIYYITDEEIIENTHNSTAIYCHTAISFTVSGWRYKDFVGREFSLEEDGAPSTKAKMSYFDNGKRIPFEEGVLIFAALIKYQLWRCAMAFYIRDINVETFARSEEELSSVLFEIYTLIFDKAFDQYFDKDARAFDHHTLSPNGSSKDLAVAITMKMRLIMENHPQYFGEDYLRDYYYLSSALKNQFIYDSGAPVSKDRELDICLGIHQTSPVISFKLGYIRQKG